MMYTRELDDDMHAGLRECGYYLCRCPGLFTRDSATWQQCRRCGRRIHRRYDDEAIRQQRVKRIRAHWAAAKINPPTQEDS